MLEIKPNFFSWTLLCFETLLTGLANYSTQKSNVPVPVLVWRCNGCGKTSTRLSLELSKGLVSYPWLWSLLKFLEVVIVSFGCLSNHSKMKDIRDNDQNYSEWDSIDESTLPVQEGNWWWSLCLWLLEWVQQLPSAWLVVLVLEWPWRWGDCSSWAADAGAWPWPWPWPGLGGWAQVGKGIDWGFPHSLLGGHSETKEKYNALFDI